MRPIRRVRALSDCWVDPADLARIGEVILVFDWKERSRLAPPKSAASASIASEAICVPRNLIMTGPNRMAKHAPRKFILIGIITVLATTFCSIMWMSLHPEARGHVSHFEGLVLSPDEKTIYVLDTIAEGIATISLEKRSHTKTIPIPGETYGLVFNTSGDKAFILNYQQKIGTSLMEVDIASSRIDRAMPIGETSRGSIAIAPDGAFLFVASDNMANRTSRILKINSETNAIVDSFEISDVESPVTLSRDGNWAYLCSRSTSNECKLRVYSTRTHILASDVNIGNECPSGLSASVNNNIIAVSTAQMGGRIRVIDVSSKRVSTPISVNQYPGNLTFSGDGKVLYIINAGDDSAEMPTMSVIDIRERKVVNETQFDKHPQYLVASRDGKRVYLLAGGQAVPGNRGYVIIVDANRNAVVDQIRIGTTDGFIKDSVWDLASWVRRSFFSQRPQPI
jgi:DNA-binding beta-propeller fold protein YncE